MRGHLEFVKDHNVSFSSDSCNFTRYESLDLKQRILKSMDSLHNLLIASSAFDNFLFSFCIRQHIHFIHFIKVYMGTLNWCYTSSTAGSYSSFVCSKDYEKRLQTLKLFDQYVTSKLFYKTRKHQCCSFFHELY